MFFIRAGRGYGEPVVLSPGPSSVVTLEVASNSQDDAFRHWLVRFAEVLYRERRIWRKVWLRQLEKTNGVVEV